MLLHVLLLPAWLLGAEPLTSLAAVRALDAEVAARNLPVTVEGVVLGLQPGTPANAFLHDGATGCSIRWSGLGPQPDLVPGTRVRVTGVTDPNGFQPCVGGATYTVLGRSPLPPPLHPDGEGLRAPEHDSAWIEVPARILSLAVIDGRLTLQLRVFGAVYPAEMPVDNVPPGWASQALQHPARIRGVLGTVYNVDHQMTGRMLFIAGPGDVQVQQGPEGASAAEPIMVTGLLSSLHGPERLVRVRGTVLQVHPEGCYLRDATGATFVHTADQAGLTRGTEITAEGYGDFGLYRPVLRAIRVATNGSAPVHPHLLERFGITDLLAHHRDLVVVQAEVLGIRSGPRESVLECRAAGRVFEAILPTTPDLTPGDLIQMTGICEAYPNRPIPRSMTVGGFRLLLADASALQVITPAPWWTTTRLAWVVAALAALMAASGLWIAQLRRQVRQHLERIGASLRAEAVAGERDRLARELHDTLEQNLAGIGLQLEGADRILEREPTGARRAIHLARDMLRQTRTEARRSVWDLRSQILMEQGLEAALASLVEASRGPGGPDLSLAVHGQARPVPADVAFHVFRVTQEALANALKHARARTIAVELDYTPDGLGVVIQDDGAGFTPGAPAGPGMHFGLVGMEERAARVGGRLTINAAPGAGCRIHLQWTDSGHHESTTP